MRQDWLARSGRGAHALEAFPTLITSLSAPPAAGPWTGEWILKTFSPNLRTRPWAGNCPRIPMPWTPTTGDARCFRSERRGPRGFRPLALSVGSGLCRAWGLTGLGGLSDVGRWCRAGARVESGGAAPYRNGRASECSPPLPRDQAGAACDPIARVTAGRRRSLVIFHRHVLGTFFCRKCQTVSSPSGEKSGMNSMLLVH